MVYRIYWDSILTLHHLDAFLHLIVCQESFRPFYESNLMALQPFLKIGTELSDLELIGVRSIQEISMSKEQAAYALAQVTAETAIPPLSHFASARALLECRVRLRDYLDDLLIEALVASLSTAGAVLHWRKLDSQVYASAIGSGVAACIDTTPGKETVYLRYSNEVAAAVRNAARGAELPRSLIGMQSNLHDRFEPLLAAARKHILQGMVDQVA